MFMVRRWSTRHARFLERFYDSFAAMLVTMHPLFHRIGYGRVEKPVAAVERLVKRFLFDSQMCGSCTLGSTGMACPMNCPKTMRNGPCGGVRSNGNCEIKPEMPCVWLEAYAGSLVMQGGDAIRDIQPALDHRLNGSSSWLREVREKAADKERGA